MCSEVMRRVEDVQSESVKKAVSESSNGIQNAALQLCVFECCQ